MSKRNVREAGKVNIVSILVVAVVIGGIYSAWKFGPPYMRKFKAQSALIEIADQQGKKGHQIDEEKAAAIKKLTIEKLRDLGIVDPDLKVDVKTRGSVLHVSASYTETVKHLIGKKVSRLRFSPSGEKDTAFRQNTK